MRSNKTRTLVFCSVCIALAFITSYIKLFPMPYGGTVTLFSMLFVVLPGNWFGPRAGIICGLITGLLVFLTDPVFLNLPQFLLDYLAAYGVLGIAGFFRNKTHGLLKGYWTAILLRGAFASLAGYCFWYSYMPEDFPKVIAVLYPIVYNYLYILIESAITTVFISIPAVSKTIGRIKNYALGGHRL